MHFWLCKKGQSRKVKGHRQARGHREVRGHREATGLRQVGGHREAVGHRLEGLLPDDPTLLDTAIPMKACILGLPQAVLLPVHPFSNTLSDTWAVDFTASLIIKF